jgi:hypothetical protein
MTHTLGPWRAGAKIIQSHNGTLVVNMCDPEFEMTFDDAHLIAAAPDMLAALKALTIAAEYSLKNGMAPTDFGVRVKDASAAIAKAEGKQE